MRVVVAPDKFKGSLTAPQVARAVEDGVRRLWPGAEVDACPVADGGDGTIDVLLHALGGRVERLVVTGPVGSPVEASLGRLPDGTAVVESASACGLALMGEAPPEPLTATSRGVGELIRHAVEQDPNPTVIVGVGGTASSDGGTGMASALGWSFLDDAGRELPPGGEALQRLARIDGADALRLASMVALVDVDNPLTGPKGAARVFSPQKGADDDEVVVLERGLARFEEVVERDVGIALNGVAGAGAGGGLGGGLHAFCGARFIPGAQHIAGITHLRERLESADLVVTGEGRIDRQTLGGKVVAAVAELAGAAGIPCVAIAGVLELDPAELARIGIADARSLSATVGLERALADPSGSIRETVHRLLTEINLDQ